LAYTTVADLGTVFFLYNI